MTMIPQRGKDEHQHPGITSSPPCLSVVPNLPPEFIRSCLNCSKATASLPQQRFISVINLISTVTDSPKTSARVCLKLLGHMSATTLSSGMPKYTGDACRCSFEQSTYHAGSLKRRLIYAKRGKGFSKMVDTAKEYLYRSSLSTKDFNNYSHHRSLTNRLGNAASTQQHHPRLMVHIGVQPAYKFAGATSRLERMQSLSTTNQG